MVVTPLSPRGEISFLLDKDKVEVAEERMRAPPRSGVPLSKCVQARIEYAVSTHRTSSPERHRMPTTDTLNTDPSASHAHRVTG